MDALDTVLLFTLCLNTIYGFTILDAYNNERNNLINQETEHYLGGGLKLSDNETIVNNLLKYLKTEELEGMIEHSDRFNLSKHYFSYKKHLEGSQVYQILKHMPKGAALHLHASFLLGSDDLLKFTYEDHLYACLEENELKFLFSEELPTKQCLDKWILLQDIRKNPEDIVKIDERIKKHLTMYTDDESQYNIDSKEAWEKFDKLYETLKPLITYRPVYEKYIKTYLNNFYADNVMYVEIRTSLKRLYELDGTMHDGEFFVNLYNSVVKQFKCDHPNFIGLKIIVTKKRQAACKEILSDMQWLRTHKEYSDLIAGYDLTGQEDLGKPLANFLPILTQAREEISFYFHGGETNWNGTPVDENLVDAVLLGAKRIGHAFALTKHPTLLSIIKQKDIAIEVNVISNVVLSYVDDVRNHPLASYLAMGLPVVLSSDDPGAWDASPLSDDYYVTFVGVASKHADLKLLKQLAINSIRYSALSNKEKTKAFKFFSRDWNKFVNDIVAKFTDQR